MIGKINIKLAELIESYVNYTIYYIVTLVICWNLWINKQFIFN